ncbi:MAG: hypothetical protein HYS12_16920 [Planctomycetes bacterium]|nr:hypothetical protein [Planctomycetota bacterium]
MKNMFKGVALLCAAVLVVPAARGDDVPNFNKRGDSDKDFAKRVGIAIVKKARPTTKDFTLQDYKFKETKPGRTELRLEIGYKGATGFTKYTAKPVVVIDTSDKDKWEVVRIDYEDNNRLTYSRKNLENLVKEFNAASK